jgi:hypothetical protein
MSRLDFAGEFRARGIKNNDVPQTRKRTRSGTEGEMDKRDRAVTDAKPVRHPAERN